MTEKRDFPVEKPEELSSVEWTKWDEYEPTEAELKDAEALDKRLTVELDAKAQTLGYSRKQTPFLDRFKKT